MLIYFSSLFKELPQLKYILKQLQVRSRVLQVQLVCYHQCRLLSQTRHPAQHQCLWRITTGAPSSTRPVEATANAPTPAEAAAQAAWDENSEQVQGIICSCISQTLRPHIGTTCTQTWTNFRTRFSTPGVSEITVDMYAVYLMKLSLTHNSHPEIGRASCRERV